MASPFDRLRVRPIKALMLSLSKHEGKVIRRHRGAYAPSLQNPAARRAPGF